MPVVPKIDYSGLPDKEFRDEAIDFSGLPDKSSELMPSMPISDQVEADKIKTSITNSYLFGIPVSNAYNLHDQLEEGKVSRGIDIQKLKGTSTLGISHPEQTQKGILAPPPPIDYKKGLLEELPKGISVGAAGTVAGMLSGVEWLLDDVPGLEGIAELSKEGSAILKEGIKALHPERTFFTDIGSVIGSMGTFLLPGGVVSKGIGKISTVAPSIANWLGVGTMTTMEALTEAGVVFDEKRDLTDRENQAGEDMEGYIPKDPKSEAEKAARITFASNIPLLLITNKLGIFADKGSMISKALRSYISEGTQESVQEVISTLSIDNPEDRLKAEKVLYAGFLGGFGGAGASVVLGMVDGASREARRAKIMPLDVKAVYEGMVDGLEAKGVDSETAHKEATKTIARMESGNEYLNQVGQSVDSAIAIDAVLEKVKGEILDTADQVEEITPIIEEALTSLEEVLQGEREITDTEIGDAFDNLVGLETAEAEISPELELLAQEARKYKSAEEFVKAQGKPLYHGGKKIIDKITKEGMKTKTGEERLGFYLTPDMGYAQIFAGRRGSSVSREGITEIYAKFKKPFKIEGAENDLLIESPFSHSQYIGELRGKGYDAIVSSDGRQVLVLDISRVFTKSQLTDFYNQAMKGEGVEETPTRLISDEAYQNAQIRIKEKLKGLKVGIDPTIISDMVITGAYHIESGVRKFGEWSKVMVKNYGKKIKPYLRDIWKQANAYLSQKIPKGEVKGVVRKATGQVVDEELNNLKYAFIKASRAAREAYRAGNIEGVAKESARMAEILTRAKIRSEESVSIKKDIKTLKKLQKRAEGKIALDYQKKIDEILGDMDLTKPTEETIERLRGLNEFIQREGVPLGISQKDLNQLDRLNRISFKDMSKEARAELIETAKKFYDLGKLKRKLQLSKEHRQLVKDLDDLIAETVNQDPILSGEAKPTKLDNFKVGLKKASMDVLHTFRQADIADGSKDYQGPNARMSKEQMHTEIALKNEAQRRVHEGIMEKITALGIDEISEEMSRRINIVLMAEQGARGQVATLLEEYGMKSVPELNKTEKAIVDIVRTEIGAKTNEIAKVYEERENLPFPKIENYFPIKYEKEFNVSPSDTINQNRYRTKQTEQGFTVERLPGVKKIPRADFLAVAEEAIQDQEWYIQMQPLLDKHNSLIRTPEYKAVAGEMMWNWWKDQIDIVARKGWSATAHANPALRQARLNLNQAILGYKATSILMQPFAIFDAMSYATARWGIDAGKDVAIEFSKVWMNPRRAMEFVQESPALKLRKAGEVAVEETLEKIEGMKGVKKKFFEYSLQGLRTADVITASGVQQGLLKVLAKHGIPNAEAEADFLMNVVSGSSEVTIRPHILARGEVARTWFTFQTFFLNRWGIVSHDIIRTGFKGDWKRKATSLLGVMIMVAGGMAEDEARDFIYKLTTGKKTGITEESLFKKVILYLPRQIPIIGSLFEKWASAEPPILRTAEKIGVGVQQITTGKWIAGLEKTIEGIMTLLLGVPGTAQMFDLMERLTAEAKKEESKSQKQQSKGVWR